MSVPTHVCVIGGGPQGLVALKSLLELNEDGNKIFAVDLLEAKDCIGGKWKYTTDQKEITALPGTVQNSSRFKNCYTDFPVADAWRRGGRKEPIPTYLNQEETSFYLEQYAECFGLLEHIRFGRKATKLERDETKGQWRIDISHVLSGNIETKYYDKVIVASGQHHDALLPRIEGIEHFKGKTLHSAKFKTNAPFRGQDVLVVGSSNSASDVATELTGTAKSVLVSHRRGVTIAPRLFQNKPLDVVLNRRIDSAIAAVTSFAPAYITATLEPMMRKMTADAWKDRIRPEWELNPQSAPSIFFTPPMITDTIVPLLEAGAVQFVPNVLRVLEDGTVELQNGRKLQVDTMIYCTGYTVDSTLAGPVERQGELQLPRLYRKIYHPAYPDSLTYLTFWHTVAGICELGDLAAMGIAQVYAGRFELPGREIMDREIDVSHAFVNGLAARSPKPISLSAASQCLDRGPWVRFLHEAAGTEARKKLGYRLEGWKFWWSDRELCNLLMSGVDSIHTARLFDGRPGSRKKWHGARQAIIEANEDLKRIEESLRAESEAQANKTL